MTIKLRQLNHLLAMDEHGSFSRAAAALHLSQPALSRSIQALEVQVGAPLFFRDGHGTVPTDLGRVLIHHARLITRMTETLNQQITSNPALVSQELVIGTGPYPGETIVSRAIGQFLDAHPRIKVRVEVRNWDELLVKLRNHELGMFIAEISTLDREPDLHIEALANHPLYSMARAGHPLAGRSPVGIGDLLHYPIIAPSRIPPRVLEPVLAALSKSPGMYAAASAFPALTCSDFSMARQVVTGSDAIMVGSLGCVAEQLERNEFAVLGTEPWMQMNYGVVTLKAGQPMSNAMLMFREYLNQAEQAITEEEKSLIAKWVPAR